MEAFSTVIWVLVPILIILPYIMRYMLKRCKKAARNQARGNVRLATRRRNISNTFCFCLVPNITSALEREIVFAKYNAFLSRFQYIAKQIATGLIFYSFTYSLLRRNIGTQHAYILNIIFHVIQLISIQIFLKTSLTNPGIIRNKSNMDLTGVNQIRTFSDIERIDFEPISIDPDNAPPHFCWRCKFVRPIRSKHDYDIDACVAVFDHYSTIYGNSIGAYNHQYFLLSMILDMFVYIISVYMCIDLLVFNSINQYSNIGGWITWLLTFWYILYNSSIPLFGIPFHIYLAITNQTTYEMIKPQVAARHNRYLNGLKRAAIGATYREQQRARGVERNMHYEISFHSGYIENMVEFVRGYVNHDEYFHDYQCVLRYLDDSDDSDY